MPDEGAPLDHERFVVVTGGPGAGKTTLLAALHDRGFPVMAEAARAIIQTQVLIGGRGLESRDQQLFAELMLSWDIRSYRTAVHETTGPVFFDRSLAELPGYYRSMGSPTPPYVLEAVRRFRYGSTVFLAPAWRDIYRNDTERTQTWEHAVRVTEVAREQYVDAGYDVVGLPCAPVADRAEFVLETLHERWGRS